MFRDAEIAHLVRAMIEEPTLTSGIIRMLQNMGVSFDEIARRRAAAQAG